MDQKNLQANMISLFQETGKYAQKFHKKTYESDMETLKERYSNLLDEIKGIIEESDDDMEEIAAYVPDYVAEQLSNISSKRKKDIACLDNNMNMVSYYNGRDYQCKNQTFYREDGGDLEQKYAGV